ncbi:MAG: hypothetical protein M3499_07425 [Actinomycetota bacterium]|nr:hypothetical protein [Actinomycetota bacterium]
MASLLVRNARLVPIAPGDDAPDHPVDVLVEHRNGSTSPLPGRRRTPPGWSPSGSLRYPRHPVIGWGHRSGGWDRDVTVSELDAVSGNSVVVLISGDGHHAWLNTTALVHLALPVRDEVVREAEWYAAYPRLAAIVGTDGTSPKAYRRTLDAAAAAGVVGLVDFEAGDGGPSKWTERWSQGCDRLRIRAAIYADSLRRSSPTVCAPVTRFPDVTTGQRWGRSRSFPTAR